MATLTPTTVGITGVPRWLADVTLAPDWWYGPRDLRMRVTVNVKRRRCLAAWMLLTGRGRVKVQR